MRRIIFAISGASGMPLASAMLAALRSLPEVELSLIISKAALLTMKAEGNIDPDKLGEGLPRHEPDDFAAPMASGSWRHSGMIVCPCSMSSLAAIASGNGVNLIHRAADVALKERRPLILVVRETPYSLIHIENMRLATLAGAIIMPFSPAFYLGDSSMRGNMRQFSGRVMDLLRLDHNFCDRWQENQAGEHGT